jgi:hypothetical protein
VQSSQARNLGEFKLVQQTFSEFLATVVFFNDQLAISFFSK